MVEGEVAEDQNRPDGMVPKGRLWGKAVYWLETKNQTKIESLVHSKRPLLMNLNVMT